MSHDEASPTHAFYDRISRVYDALADSSEHAVREKGLELLDVQAGERVLEIGYGTGHSLVELARRVGPEGSVAGIDASQGMHDVAWRRVREAGYGGNVELRVDAVPPAPYPDHSFDAVFLSFTLELFPLDVIPEVLGEIGRVLDPSGRVGVVAMSAVPEGEHESLIERTYKWMHQHFPHIVDCQPIPVARLLEAAGFAVRRQETMEIWTMPVSAIVADL
jgi:demethylmenaquinone methyltransferase/2-methoxy-6-polyprenyl-1,4-benzoquinol methylase